MKLLDSMSPTRVTLLSIAGSTAVLGAALMGSLKPSPRHSVPWELLAVVLFGYAVMSVAEMHVTGGIKSRQLSEVELGPLRRLVEHPAWTAVQVATMLIFAGFMILSASTERATLFPIGLLAFLNITRIGWALKPSAAARPRIDGGGVAPMRSEHWGEARAANSESNA